jgi:hypothetical protein
MSLTPKDWFDLGYEMGDIRNKMINLWFTVQSKFGKNAKLTQVFAKLYKDRIMVLQSRLDNKICKFYPSPIPTIPGYTVKLTDVFYNLNRSIGQPIEQEKPLSKCLTSDDYNMMISTMTQLKHYVIKVNSMIFHDSDKDVVLLGGNLINLLKILNDTNLLEKTYGAQII